MMKMKMGEAEGETALRPPGFNSGQGDPSESGPSPSLSSKVLNKSESRRHIFQSGFRSVCV